MDTQTSYDRVADEYVRRISDELKDKPLDRQLLDRLQRVFAILAQSAIWVAVPAMLPVTSTNMV